MYADSFFLRFRIFPKRGQEGSDGRLPNAGRLADGLDSPVVVVVPPAAGVGRLSRGRSNDEGVHARGDGHRPEVAGRVRAGLLQVLRPDQVVHVQEEPEDRAALQQVRGAQGRVENFKNSKAKELKF